MHRYCKNDKLITGRDTDSVCLNQYYCLKRIFNPMHATEISSCFSSAVLMNSLNELVGFFTHQTDCDWYQISRRRVCCLVENYLHLLFWFCCLCFCLCAIKNVKVDSEMTKLLGGSVHCTLVRGFLHLTIKQPQNPPRCRFTTLFFF